MSKYILIVFVSVFLGQGQLFGRVKKFNTCLADLSSSSNQFKKEIFSFAGNFELYTSTNYSLLRVYYSVDNKKDFFSYLLVRNEKELFSKCPGVDRIRLPIKRVATFSTSHLPFISILGKNDSLVGFSNLNYINDSDLIKRKQKGNIKEVGFPPNPEILLSIKPDVIFAYATESLSLEGIQKLIEMRMPVVLVSEFLEESPLARAEWLKFFAVFFDKEAEAKKLFDDIKDRYEQLKNKVKKISKKKIIAIGENYHGTWYAPGGRSDLVTMIKDAGGEYLWKRFDVRKQTAINLERAFIDMMQAEIWLPQNRWNNIKELINADVRYQQLKVTKDKGIYNNNARMSSGGGNDYWEMGMARPDLLLGDLVKIFYSQLLPEHQLHWYKKLE